MYRGIGVVLFTLPVSSYMYSCSIEHWNFIMRDKFNYYTFITYLHLIP